MDDPIGRDAGWEQRSDDPLSEALRDVLRLAALARPLVARRLGLNVSEVWALEHLSDEPLGTVELARRLDMTSAAATTLTHRLEAAGHLTREPHPTDGRRTVLRPTPHAFAEMAPVMGPFLAELDEASATLSDAERQVIADYLTKVAAALSRLDD